MKLITLPQKPYPSEKLLSFLSHQDAVILFPYNRSLYPKTAYGIIQIKFNDVWTVYSPVAHLENIELIREELEVKS